MFTTSALMADAGIKAVFSHREGGCSSPPFDSLNLGIGLGDQAEHVTTNLTRFCQSAGLLRPHQSQQVHGVTVLHCSGAGQMHDDDADILLTTELNTPLAIRTADCLPILLADKQAQVIAAVHAGWRGTVAQITQVAVREMLALGADVERIRASFGACIAPCCFEINASIKQAFLACGDEDVCVWRDHRWYADLALSNRYQLMACGLPAQHIEMTAACTMCHKQPSYFSYRRDAGQTGRQLSVIVLE